MSGKVQTNAGTGLDPTQPLQLAIAEASLVPLTITGVPATPLIPTFVQGTGASDGGNTTSLSVELLNNTGLGNTLLVAVTFNNLGDNSGVTVTDTQGNTYTLLTTTNGNLANPLYVFAALNISAGANTITATLNEENPVTVSVSEYYGVASTNPLDQSATYWAYRPNGNPQSVGPITPQDNGELLFAVLASGGPLTNTINLPFTVRAAQGGNNQSLLTADAVGTTESVTATWAAVDNGCSLAIVSLKAGLGGGQTAPLIQFEGPYGTGASVNAQGQIVFDTLTGKPTSVPSVGTTTFDPSANKLWVYGSTGWKGVVLS